MLIYKAQKQLFIELVFNVVFQAIFALPLFKVILWKVRHMNFPQNLFFPLQNIYLRVFWRNWRLEDKCVELKKKIPNLFGNWSLAYLAGSRLMISWPYIHKSDHTDTSKMLRIKSQIQLCFGKHCVTKGWNLVVI